MNFHTCLLRYELDGIASLVTDHPMPSFKLDIFSSPNRAKQIPLPSDPMRAELGYQIYFQARVVPGLEFEFVNKPSQSSSNSLVQAISKLKRACYTLSWVKIVLEKKKKKKLELAKIGQIKTTHSKSINFAQHQTVLSKRGALESPQKI